MAKKLKARIHKNVWDNWYGYLGTRRVEQFFNTPYATAEQNAKAWLAEQNKHQHTCPDCRETLTCNDPDCTLPHGSLALCGSCPATADSIETCDAQDEDDEHTCHVCSGPIVVMGALGNTIHGRCRDCGLPYNWRG